MGAHRRRHPLAAHQARPHRHPRRAGSARGVSGARTLTAIIAIDQGTTSTRAIRFGTDGRPQQTASRPLRQHYPQPGWVEHDPEDLWRDTLAVVGEVLTDDVAAIGITNQRETILLWDRATGAPLHRAIVWQDRRTAARCAALAADGLEPMVTARTGLLLDPYFSASKLQWLLETIPHARARAERGELAAGTVDSFLLWRLTGGRIHATDVTNAARTMLWNIHEQDWDAELLRLFGVHPSLLPHVHDNAHLFGETDPALFGRAIPIAGMAGDQQAAMIGQACFQPGMVKATYGTGCFMLMHTGAEPVASASRLLTTPAYRIAGEIAYALEGSTFVAGAGVQWLRDKLGLIADAAESADLAASVPDDHGVTVIPAFVGLGAPHWRSELQGSIHGLTLDTSAAHLVRAVLESVAFQTGDLAAAMRSDGASDASALRVDGGMATNNWFCQFLADVLAVPVERPAMHETTALGAAYLAGLTMGLWPALEAIGERWAAAARFEPGMSEERRGTLLQGWKRALQQALR